MARPTRRWLSDLAKLHDALNQSTAFQAALRSGVRAAVGVPGAWGDVVEEQVIARLTDPAVAATIRAEVCVLASRLGLHDLPPVSGVRFENVQGSRLSLDCWVVWEHHDSSETRVPLNIKSADAARTGTTADLAVSLRQFLLHVTDPEHDLEHPKRNGPSADDLLVEMMAGTRKLVPGRDYYLLILTTDGGELVKWRWHGLLSSLDAEGRLAIRRHKSRENVLFVPRSRVIHAGFDIRAAVIAELMPSGSPSALRAAIVSAAPKSRRRATAQVISGLSDDELLRLVGVLVRDAA